MAVELVQADIVDLKPFGEAVFDFALAQGDPLSFCSHPPRAVRSLHRVLRPGGFCVASVDGTYGGLDPVLDKEGAEGLESFLATGKTRWLARQEEAEAFPIRTFTPEGLRRLFSRAGFRVDGLIGKTVLPVRRLRERLEDRDLYLRLLRLERRLHSRESLLGRAAHLEIAACRETGPC